MLKRQIALLEITSEVCTTEAAEVLKAFEEWQEFTRILLSAMNIEKGEDSNIRKKHKIAEKRRVL
jgi:hypothetical protein